MGRFSAAISAGVVVLTVTVTVSAQTPTIQLLSPNGGETIVAGQEYPIRWVQSGFEHEPYPWEPPTFSLVRPGSWWETSIQYTYFAGGEATWFVCPYTPPGDDYRLRIVRWEGDRRVEDLSDAPFTITGSLPDPTFVITAPAAGDLVRAGGPFKVSWTSTATEGQVSLNLYKGGVYRLQIDWADATAGTFTGTLCKYLEDGTDYTVHLRWGACDHQIQATSAPFAIVGGQPKPTVTLTSPVGGEVWQAGTTHPITWTSTNPEGSVRVEIVGEDSYSGVERFTVPMADGRIDWNICPYLKAGSQYRVRISWLDFYCVGSGEAYSPGVFTVLSGAPFPTIQVLSPIGGENWAAGTRQTIRWSADNTNGWANVALRKGGEYIQDLGTVPLAEGCLEWDICPVGFDGDDYTIEVEWAASCGYTWVEADSPLPFAIAGSQPEPTVQQLSPVGGEVLAAGERLTVTWSSVHPTGDMSVQLLKGGMPFTWMGTVPMVDGRFEWDTCPVTPDGDDYSIALSWGTCLGAHMLVMPEKFSIRGAPGNPPVPTLELTRPVGGEVWTAGTTEQITWASTNPAADVLVYVEFADTWQTQLLGRAPMADGTFNWTIPTCTPQGEYLVILQPICGNSASNGWVWVFPAEGTWTADLDGNCVVDRADLILFRACFTGSGVRYDPGDLPSRCTSAVDGQGHIAADYDKDGDVDQDDFGVFQRGWGGGSDAVAR